MTHSDAKEDEFQVSAQDFNKLTDIHHKVSGKLEEVRRMQYCETYTAANCCIFQSGFKDGISDGREQKYQEGFDAGFRDGFHHAFLVGKYMALQKDTNGDLLLKNPKLGHCQICLDSLLLDKDLKQLEEVNSAHTRKIHERIEEKYKNLPS